MMDVPGVLVLVLTGVTMLDPTTHRIEADLEPDPVADGGALNSLPRPSSAPRTATTAAAANRGTRWRGQRPRVRSGAVSGRSAEAVTGSR